MRRAPIAVLLCASLVPAVASAGNNDEVNAGVDVTLTGGAVVANVYTGASLWYNPAGIARIARSSVELTGVTLKVDIRHAPGLVTIETDPPSKSDGKIVNLTVVPEALTFTYRMRENLKLGVGLFNSSIRRQLVTQQVDSPAEASPSVQATAGRDARLDFFHISSGLAGAVGKKRRVLCGGAFDLVIANSRMDDTTGFFYDGGTGGLVSNSRVHTQFGFGFQLKAGIQWVPHPKLRVGFSLASPSYLFVLAERYAQNFTQAPPAGTVDSNDPQTASGQEYRDAQGGWFGAEPGTLRAGLAYVGSWGWIEGDLVVLWKLREPNLDIDLHTVINGRLGASFRLIKGVQLGLGAFTDFSQAHELSQLSFGTQEFNLYGLHLGFLFSNQEIDPRQAQPSESSNKRGLGLTLAIGLRYGHGRGDMVGISVPTQYDPSAVEPVPVGLKVNEIAINLGAKVSF